MARIQHLAIASQDPEKMAEFMKQTFGFTEVRRLDNPRARGVVLSDGSLNISILKFHQDQIGRGLDFTGPHHFGVYVEDLDGVANKVLELGGREHEELPEDANEVNYRKKRSDKFHGPEGILFDIADEPWIGTQPMKAAAE
jgi:catechol 2,3-dioxygenase-like lactoylglutathione lyase family enzyme